MAAIDFEIDRFYGEIASMRFRLSEINSWISDYESKRYNYPPWKTKDGDSIKVYDITDEHLSHLIPFLEKKDPKNETKWVDLFKCEMTYRKIKEERKAIQENLSKYEEIGELCL